METDTYFVLHLGSLEYLTLLVAVLLVGYAVGRALPRNGLLQLLGAPLALLALLIATTCVVAGHVFLQGYVLGWGFSPAGLWGFAAEMERSLPLLLQLLGLAAFEVGRRHRNTS